MRSTLALIGAALTLGACATASNYPPVMVEGQPDVARFKVYVGLGVPERHADKVIAPELDAYRAKNGYRSYAVLDTQWHHIPTHYEYTVRFDR